MALTINSVRSLLRWFYTHRRTLPWREQVSAYRTWVSEIMLQQTQVATVVPYFERFLRQFPDVASLARAPLADVLKAWEGLGYYRRARNLHRAAGVLLADGAEALPDNLAALRALPGIGEYTAAAIGSIAFGLPEPVVDGNVVRVFCRVFALDDDAKAATTRRVIRERLRPWIADAPPGDFNQAIMELGALVCTPTAQPLCGDCPLRQVCKARPEGRVAELPRTAQRVAIPTRHGVCAVIERRGKWLMVQRPADGLLGGLWEFPTVATDGIPPERTLRRELARVTGLALPLLRELGEVSHTYSHFRQSLRTFHAKVTAGRVRIASGQPFRWLAIGDRKTLPLPKITLKVMHLAGTHR